MPNSDINIIRPTPRQRGWTDLDLRAIEWALRVKELGGFRAAAQALGIEQSRLSRRIQTLELDLGLSLFERDRRGARPSELGLELLESLRHSGRQIEASIEAARLAASPNDNWRIAICHEAAGTIAHRAIVNEARLRGRNIAWMHMPRDHALQSFDEGKIDALVGPEGGAELRRCEHLIVESIGLAIAQSVPLEEAGAVQCSTDIWSALSESTRSQVGDRVGGVELVETTSDVLLRSLLAQSGAVICLADDGALWRGRLEITLLDDLGMTIQFVWKPAFAPQAATMVHAFVAAALETAS